MREQVGEGIAHHRAPGVPDVERPPVGLVETYSTLDRPAAAEVCGAVPWAGLEQLRQPRPPELVREPEVDEAGAGHFDGTNVRAPVQPFSQMLGDFARLASRLFGEDQCRITRRIAVLCLARRLDRDSREIEPARQQASPAHRLNFDLNNI